jgi:PKD repeat protein
MRNLGWVGWAMGGVVLAACGGDGGTPQGPSNAPPVVNFGSSCAALTCTFTDSSSDSDGSITARHWNFGDGGSDTVQNPVHTFAAAQPYNVTLAVTDNGGATDSTTKSVTPAAPSTDLTCTDGAAPGGTATCSLTLPQDGGITAVLSNRTACEAHGDVFAFTAPVADTLTTDGCFDTIGKQVQLAASPAGTQVDIAIKSGLTQYGTGVQVTGQYPEWTLNIEDAVGAPFPANFSDMIVTLTVQPTGP